MLRVSSPRPLRVPPGELREMWCHEEGVRLMQLSASLANPRTLVPRNCQLTNLAPAGTPAREASPELEC